MREGTDGGKGNTRVELIGLGTATMIYQINAIIAIAINFAITYGSSRKKIPLSFAFLPSSSLMGSPWILQDLFCRVPSFLTSPPTRKAQTRKKSRYLRSHNWYRRRIYTA